MTFLQDPPKKKRDKDLSKDKEVRNEVINVVMNGEEVNWYNNNCLYIYQLLFVIVFKIAFTIEY